MKSIRTISFASSPARQNLAEASPASEIKMERSTFLAGPGGRYYSKAGAKQQKSTHLSAAEGSAVLRAARMGVQVLGDFAVRVRVTAKV